MRDKKGFTLTELLAVIVLIGVILAIAVPSYQSYVTRTREEVLKSYQANIIDAANQYAAECFQENKLGECKGKENIWNDIKKNLKNGDDIEKEYTVTVKIDNGPSNVSALYSITLTLEMKKKGSEPITKKTSNTNTSGSTGTQTDSSININGKPLNTENNTIEGIFPTKQTLNITGSVKQVMLKDKETTCTSKTSLFNTTTTCDLTLENGENKIIITYKDGNEKEITIKADTISPKIEPSNINTSPTNKVEFTVTINDDHLDSVKSPKECKIEEDKEKIKRYTCTITENGKYSFSATDKAGNIEAKDIKISTITSEKPSVILNIDNEAVSKSKSIEIEYVSGSNDNEIGFNADQKLKWKLINTSSNKEEKTGEIPIQSNKGSEKVEIKDLTGTYRFIVESLTNKAGNKNNDEECTIRLDNTPPSAAVISMPSKDKEETKSVECRDLDSNGNRECKVVFYGGFLGKEVKAKLDFTVEDIGSSEVGKVYYRTTTTGNFTETTVEAINNLKHKDFGKEQLNLYIEVVFADALGNIDYTKNITKITFVKN